LMVAAGKTGVPITQVGRFGGNVIRLGASEATLADLSALYRSAFATAVA